MTDKIKDAIICDCENPDIKTFKTKCDTFAMCNTCYEGDALKTEGCCVNPTLIDVILPMTNGKPTRREFCTKCGYCSGMKKLGDISNLQTLNPGMLDSLRHERHKKKRAFYNYRQGFLRMSYHEYLKTDEWKVISKKVLERDNYICQGCLENKATQAHHKTYRSIYDEMLFDLVAVCKSCHDRIHKDDNKEQDV